MAYDWLRSRFGHFSLPRVEDWLRAGSVVLFTQPANQRLAASAWMKVESGAAGEAKESPPDREKKRAGRHVTSRRLLASCLRDGS